MTPLYGIVTITKQSRSIGSTLFQVILQLFDVMLKI